MALAPSRALLGVASSAIKVSSILTCASASMPPTASKISPLTASTALRTPLPRKRALSPSRSSIASCAPVEAPDGTPARPREPSSSTTSTSTVGLPRLSRISRPLMSTIAVMKGGSLLHSLRAACSECRGSRQAGPDRPNSPNSAEGPHALCRPCPAGRRGRATHRPDILGHLFAGTVPVGRRRGPRRHPAERDRLLSLSRLVHGGRHLPHRNRPARPRPDSARDHRESPDPPADH